jgi:hypothetical protein
MKADTYARLVVLESLVDAEIGHRLAHGAGERWIEAMVARVSDLVDEIDALDAIAAARAYDALVDFLTDLPEDDGALVEQTVAFKRAVDRIVVRGMDEAALAAPPTWATVLDELLAALAAEYARPGDADGTAPGARRRARALAARARAAADRMVAGERAERRAEVRTAMDRLAFAVHDRRLSAADVEGLVAEARRLASRYRPSKLTRIGAYVVSQLLRRPGEADAP